MADADTFTFLGPDPVVGYMAYKDLTSGTTLVASPGHTCRIGAVEEGLPMPPDARWVPAGSKDAKGAVAAAKAAAGILAAQEDGAAAEAPADPGPPGGDTGTPDGGESTGAGE